MKRIKVIILKDVSGLALRGDIKEVSLGYAKNFLLPRNLAVILTPSKIKQIELEKNIQKEKEKKEMERAKKIRQRLKTLILEFKMAAEKEHLFGSISQKEIVKALSDKGINLSEKAVVMSSHIKTIGDHDVLLDLGHNIKAKLHIKIKGSAPSRKKSSKKKG